MLARARRLRPGCPPAYAARGSSSAAPADKRAERLRLESCAVALRSSSSSSAKIARASAVQRPRPPSRARRASRAAPRSRRACRRAGGRRAAARRCRSSGSPSAGTRCRSAGPLDAVELRPEPERDRGARVAAALADAEAQVLALADDARLTASQPATSSVTSGLPRPNGASRSSSVARPSVSAEPGTIASILVTGARSSSASTASAWAANACRERVELGSGRSRARQRHGGRRSARGAASTGGERAVQVERRAASGPSPSTRRRRPRSGRPDG